MSSKPNIFYRFLYAVITFVYLVYCKLKKLKLKFGRSLSLEDLVRLRDSRTFTKRNDHTALIVNYEDNQPLTDADLVKLIGWCLIYGIPYVTVYDHDGLLIEKREAVCQRVLNYLRENAEIVGKFDLSQGEQARSFVVKGENGYGGRLRFVDVRDGKEKIVSAVKELVQEKLAVDNNNRGSSEEFTLTNPSVLTNKLREEFEFPDPDMGIICSSIYNVYGYPPWEIRYTEFVLIPDLQDVNIRNFRECLALFNKKEQRKGK